MDGAWPQRWRLSMPVKDCSRSALYGASVPKETPDLDKGLRGVRARGKQGHTSLFLVHTANRD